MELQSTLSNSIFRKSRKDKNTPLNPLLPTVFRIVKGTVSRFVVVMDVSGSMKEFVSGQNTHNKINYCLNFDGICAIIFDKTNIIEYTFRTGLANWASPSAPGSKLISQAEMNWGWSSSGLF
jgi:hypothetical protein